MQPTENQAALKDEEEEDEEQDEQQILQYAKQQILQQTKQQQLLQQEQHTRSNGAASINNRFKSNALKQERSSGSLRKRQEASRTATIAAAAAAIAQITPATVAAAATPPAASAKAFNLNDVSSFSSTNKRHQATSSSNNRSSSNQTAAAATKAAAIATVPAAPNQLLSCRKSNSQNSPYLATPKTLTTPTRFIAAKAATVTATPTAPATSTTTSTTIGARGSSTKRVYFNLPSTIAESEQEFEHELDYDEEMEEENSMALAQAKPNVHLARKPHIVFNGTYPIDMPLTQGQSQLKSNSYDPEANADRGDLQRYRNYMLHDYVIDEDAEGEEQAEEEGEEDEYGDGDEDLFPYADDDESFDDGDYYTHQLLNKYGIIPSGEKQRVERTPASVEAATSAAQPQHVWSMKELIANPAIPLNYKKMCSEVEQSLSRFENYLDSKKEQQVPPGAAVRTFDIDAPTRRGHRSSTSTNAGLDLRSKKKL